MTKDMETVSNSLEKVMSPKERDESERQEQISVEQETISVFTSMAVGRVDSGCATERAISRVVLGGPVVYAAAASFTKIKVLTYSFPAKYGLSRSNPRDVSFIKCYKNIDEKTHCVAVVLDAPDDSLSDSAPTYFFKTLNIVYRVTTERKPFKELEIWINAQPIQVDMKGESDDKYLSVKSCNSKESNESEINYKETTTSTLKRTRLAKQKHTNIARHSEDSSPSYPKTTEEMNIEEHACGHMSYGKRQCGKGDRNLDGQVSEREGSNNKTLSCYSQMDENTVAITKLQFRDEEREDIELNSTGFISVKSCSSTASANSTSFLGFLDEETIIFENDLSDGADKRSDSASCSVFKESEMNNKGTTKSTLKRRSCTKQKQTYIIRHSEDCSPLYPKTSEEVNIKEHACGHMSYGKRQCGKEDRHLYGVSDRQGFNNESRSCYSQMDKNTAAVTKLQFCDEECEDIKSNSTGFISVKSCRSTAPTNSLSSSDEVSIIFENDLSERADRRTGSVLCSLFKESSENEMNNKKTTKRTFKRTRCTHPLYTNIVRHSEDSSLSYSKISEEASMEEQIFMHMSRERQNEKGDRTLYELVSKRRGHNNSKPGCYSQWKENCSAIVKPQLRRKDHEDMESNSTGFISVNSYNSKDGSITNAELLDTDGQAGMDRFDGPGIGNQENAKNVYIRNETTNISETQAKNSLEYMPDPITKVDQWLKEQTTKCCKMTAENAFDDSIDTKKSHYLDKLGHRDKFVTNESRKESLARHEHFIDKSHKCNLITVCAESFENEKGQFSDVTNAFPPLPDHTHRDVHVVI
ncbi:uncharacterized protein LOC123523916 isoform X2 [Mercenaria mercenaria]|uniref:uncharacterized protein LOC123523916 isoform X2 n=1 Tax=Mercenaria mercenaria TaxID=6596 RepID=UPI00234E52D8|nr:uncharacterized protein LOC123523916 isoform X2 [Mercenaria mercenaria]